MIKLQQFLKDKPIALLGNAKSILDSKKDIDKFEVVCRCNKGFPKGKEGYIGSRTDVLFLSIPLHEKIIKEEYNPKHIMWCTSKREGLTDWLKDNALFFNLDDWTNLANIIGARPSTGIIGIAYLVKYVKFKSLTLFGFDFWDTPNFYTGCKNIRNHSPSSEKAYVEYLIKEDKRISIIK